MANEPRAYRETRGPVFRSIHTNGVPAPTLKRSAQRERENCGAAGRCSTDPPSSPSNKSRVLKAVRELSSKELPKGTAVH